jgi:hypothetical protein
MYRLTLYLDRPIRLSSLPLDPGHSLIRQSTPASISADACGLVSTPAPVMRPAPYADSQRHGSNVTSHRKLPFKPLKTGEIGQQLTAQKQSPDFKIWRRPVFNYIDSDRH